MLHLTKALQGNGSSRYPPTHAMAMGGRVILFCSAAEQKHDIVLRRCVSCPWAIPAGWCGLVSWCAFRQAYASHERFQSQAQTPKDPNLNTRQLSPAPGIAAPRGRGPEKKKAPRFPGGTRDEGMSHVWLNGKPISWQEVEVLTSKQMRPATCRGRSSFTT